MKTKLSSKLLFPMLFFATIAGSYAQDLDRDIKLGEDGARMIDSVMGIYTHDPTTAYIRDVGDRLIGNLDQALFEYNFNIVDMEQPNAFALPGGHVYISRGLLCLVNSEDEMSGILGHEIMHSELRHSVKQMRTRILPALIQLPGAIVGSVVNESLGQMLNAPLNAGSQLFLASYSRKHEKQADKGGTLLMANSGYDPTQFPLILANLSTLVEAMTGKEEEFTYFDSHPYTPDRVAYLNKEISKLSTNMEPAIAADHEAFLRAMDGIYAGANPARGIFQEKNFLHPGLDLFVSFPEGWVTENRPTMVGAIDTTDNQSMLVMSLAARDKLPDELGQQFARRLQKEYDIVPDRSEKIDLNGMPAYLVSIKDNSGGSDYRIYSLWFSLNEQTFQMLGLAKESQTERLRNTALSIRSLTKKERGSIQVHTLRIREAKEGESLEAFNTRTGNAWNPKITAIMNSLEPENLLEDGQLIKVVVKEPYRHY